LIFFFKISLERAYLGLANLRFVLNYLRVMVLVCFENRLGGFTFLARILGEVLIHGMGSSPARLILEEEVVDELRLLLCLRAVGCVSQSCFYIDIRDDFLVNVAGAYDGCVGPLSFLS